MVDLLHSPFKSIFEEFADSIVSDCFICSPYITFNPVKMLMQTIVEKKVGADVQINILTDISLRTVVQGATEIPALLYLFDNHPNVSITYLPRIHAKVYIANKSSAIVTSANFTDGGEIRNFEYGVKINNNVMVQKIQSDINAYRKLGADINQTQLVEIQKQVESIRGAIQVEQKKISQKIRLESKKQERIVEDNLIRIRVKDRSTNSIFSETLLYLLSQKPMETEELHLRIKNIHPDLCDDNFDRVIDGRHFGKLWKHQVRNAQIYLKRAGLISYNEEKRLWRIADR
ncbi:MAG: phospholipase D-like domain-containing protein [Anaerolineales bacterium]|nr:MAG: phospholipase D-like domain-containing protein [Anaerolineales bacterium]